MRCTEFTEGCAEVHRGVCRGVGRCMEGYVDVQRCMDRCTWYMEVCRGAQRYVQRWRGNRCMQRCTEVCAEVCGGEQRYA